MSTSTEFFAPIPPRVDPPTAARVPRTAAATCSTIGLLIVRAFLGTPGKA